MFYRWLHEEEILVRNPAAHLKHPQISQESNTLGLDPAELGKLLYEAERARPCEYALVALLVINGLRVSEALGINIEDLTMQRGHRVVPIVGKGDKPAIIPLAPGVCRAVGLPCGERHEGPLILDPHGNRMNRHSAGGCSTSWDDGPGSGIYTLIGLGTVS